MNRAALLGCLMCVACPAAAQAAFPGSNGRILVQPNGAAAFTMNPDGSDHLAPPANFRSAVRGSLSPDGTREAYADGSGVKVRDLASGVDTPIADASHAGLPVWSSDGSQLAWQDGVTAIFRAPASGTGSVLPVAAPGAAEFFGRGISFTPDGAEIVVGINEKGCIGTCSSGHPVAIAVLTGARREITPLPPLVDDNEAGVKQVDVAGDGSRVVYLDDDSPPCPASPCPPSTTAVESVPLSGGSATTLRVGGFNKVQLPRFAPDGRAVVYLELRGDAKIEIREVGPTGADNHVVDDANGAGYGSFDALQWLSGKDCEADADGDGLCDDWERDGIDANDDGTVDLQLPGATPDHKDLFVEIDRMLGEPLDARAIADVQTAFADAPVLNADGTTGIRLHVVVDETLPANALLALPPDCGTAGAGDADFDALKAQFFGTASERAADPQVLNAKRKAFRYAIWAHALKDQGSTSGCAELPGNDFVVSLGLWGGGSGGTRGEQAATFMHELGHTLDLQHGGTDNVNCKPNYLSVMSYTFQMARAPVTGRPLDYSREVLPTLDEDHLSEPAGIGGPAGFASAFGLAPQTLIATAAPVDWTGDGTSTEPDVAADINNRGTRGCLGGGKSLQGAEDWSRLVYDFRTLADFADGDHIGQEPVDEMTHEIAAANSRDVDADGVKDFEDNCPDAANADQADADRDGVGDACSGLNPVPPVGGGGTPTPPVGRGGPPPATGPPCADRRAPDVTVRSGKVRHGRLTLGGSARDATQCTGVTAAGLARVQIALAERSGTRCRWVNTKGRLGRRASCAKPQFLTAKGTTAWSLSLRRPPAGRYELRIRVRDRAGNTTTTKTRNLTVRRR